MRPAHMRLMAILGSLGARCYATAGVLDDKDRGLAVSFWNVGKGGPLIVQQLEQGGYDCFVPLTSSGLILSSELAVLLYSQGRSRSWLDALKDGAPEDAPLLVSLLGHLDAIVEQSKLYDALPAVSELVALLDAPERAIASQLQRYTGAPEQPAGDRPSSAPPAGKTGDLEPSSAKLEALDELLANGCLTGDCPHDTQSQCDKALADHVRELAARGVAP